jgi:hypothetical protein
MMVAGARTTSDCAGRAARAEGDNSAKGKRQRAKVRNDLARVTDGMICAIALCESDNDVAWADEARLLMK